jgi:Leucine-rich repeat (LRR) protein
MNNNTIKLLSEYNYKTIHLDISNENVEGILDLKKKKFNKLEELNCSDNKITEIINLPRGLKYLNCSNNQIISLLNLPNNMTGLNCKSKIPSIFLFVMFIILISLLYFFNISLIFLSFSQNIYSISFS